jgi:FdhE protein
VRVDADVVRRHVERLATTATAVTDSRQCGASRRRGTGAPEPQALAVLRAAIANDLEAIDEAAADAGIERDVARVIAPLAAMPLLLAHARTWSGRVSPTWMHPWCPVCGAWPGLAEVRGLDRTRRFRCLRCAADWHAEWLACPYCGNREHTQLGALVSADSPETRKAETCKRCLGYIKSVTTLAPSDPLELAIVDVDTVELDIAALEHGYQRPETPAHGLGMRLEPRPARRLFRWWS